MKKVRVEKVPSGVDVDLIRDLKPGVRLTVKTNVIQIFLSGGAIT